MPRYLAHFEALASGMQPAEKVASKQWLDLDRLLVQLSESHSIRPRFMCRGEGASDQMWDLLPKMTKGGMIDLVDYKYGPQ
jgi:hypothetical protein